MFTIDAKKESSDDPARNWFIVIFDVWNRNLSVLLLDFYVQLMSINSYNK